MDSRCDNNKHLICQGDTCVIFISENQKYALKIEPDGQIQTKFGLIKAMDLLNHPYGIRYEGKKGWVLPLKLTPELWTQLLPHRTQILYQADISMILFQLDIKPGSIVVESGTGSGSLSHAILRACRPHGFLFTFDINASRVKDAQEEFQEHGFSENVKVAQRDVCELGYGDDLIGKADACVLDLPQTWDAIGHAYKILKPDGSRLCTFSPCIEQVKQNVAKMAEFKMKDIVTLETLLRPFEVREQRLRVWEGDILEGLTAIDKKRLENIKDTINSNKRRKTSEPQADDDCDEPMEAESKKASETIDDDKDNLFLLNKALSDPKAIFHPHMLPRKLYVYARQFNETVSHSGYLTFATKRL